MRVKIITADTQVADSKVNILGWALYPDGSNLASMAIYNEADSDKTAAKQVGGLRVPATESKSENFCKALVLNEGCYVDITGTNAVGFIYLE